MNYCPGNNFRLILCVYMYIYTKLDMSNVSKVTCQFCNSIVSAAYLKRHQNTAAMCLLHQERCKPLVQTKSLSDMKYVNLSKPAYGDAINKLKGVFEGFLLNYEAKKVHRLLLDKINLYYDQGFLFDDDYQRLIDAVNDNYESCKRYANMVLRDNMYQVVASSGSPPQAIKTPADMTEAISNFQYIISTIQNAINGQLQYHASEKGYSTARERCKKNDKCEYPCEWKKPLIGKEVCRYGK